MYSCNKYFFNESEVYADFSGLRLPILSISKNKKDLFTITTIEKEMTISEIEKELGYKIKIKGENNMGQRKITETIKEYDDKGNLIREQITETTENYEEITYPNYLYNSYNHYYNPDNPYNHLYNPYNPYNHLDKIINECDCIKNKYYQGPTKTCDGVPEY